MNTINWRRRVGGAVAAILVVAFSGVADAQRGKGDPRVSLRGQISAFDGNALTLKSTDGLTIVVQVPPKVRISSLTLTKFSELKKGDFIASAGMRQPDGKLKAIDVRIFPAGGRHPPEVYRRFRLGPESTMTNAWVDAIDHAKTGPSFKAKYKGGEQTIVVPDSAMVMRQDPGKRDLLKPGANVSIFASKGQDGVVKAIRIAVGMNGIMPPT